MGTCASRETDIVIIVDKKIEDNGIIRSSLLMQSGTALEEMKHKRVRKVSNPVIMEPLVCKETQHSPTRNIFDEPICKGRPDSSKRREYGETVCKGRPDSSKRREYGETVCKERPDSSRRREFDEPVCKGRPDSSKSREFDEPVCKGRPDSSKSREFDEPVCKDVPDSSTYTDPVSKNVNDSSTCVEELVGRKEMHDQAVYTDQLKFLDADQAELTESDLEDLSLKDTLSSELDLVDEGVTVDLKEEPADSEVSSKQTVYTQTEGRFIVKSTRKAYPNSVLIRIPVPAGRRIKGAHIQWRI